MTWASLLSKTLYLACAIPLAVTNLEVEAVSVWFLFLTLINIQALAYSGFTPTFSRAISFALSGVESLQRISKARDGASTGQANWELVAKILATMNIVYWRLAFFGTLLVGLGGTLALYRPINLIPESQDAWFSWGVIIVVSIITFRGSAYIAYLQGCNKIALLNRWQVLTTSCATLSMIFVLYFEGRLFALVCAHQVWQIVFVAGNYRFYRKTQGDVLLEKKGKLDPEVFDFIWPATWRSGLGILLGVIVLQMSGILYAQFASPEQASSYLLALQLLQALRQFSNAPFYSKIPMLNRFRAQGRAEDLIALARRGMLIAYWVFVFGFTFIGLVAPFAFRLIKSNVTFPSPLLWALLGIGGFIERYGAMHLQLYSTTNHIIWHIVNGVSGLIFLVFSLLLVGFIDVYAFPVALLLAYSGFYTWYSAKKSYATFGLSFWSFEKRLVTLPFVIILSYTLFTLITFA